MGKPWITTEQYVGECRRERNGANAKLVWTIMVSACGIISVGMMTWMMSLNGKIASLEAATTQQALSTTDRISSLEEGMDNLKEGVKLVDTRLNRMEGKLDLWMDRQTKQGGTR